MFIQNKSGRGFNVDGDSESLLWVVDLLEAYREETLRNLAVDQPDESTRMRRGEYQAYNRILKKIEDEVFGRNSMPSNQFD